MNSVYKLPMYQEKSGINDFPIGTRILFGDVRSVAEVVAINRTTETIKLEFEYGESYIYPLDVVLREMARARNPAFCSHVWVKTVGFNEMYVDCRLCGSKQ